MVNLIKIQAKCDFSSFLIVLIIPHTNNNIKKATTPNIIIPYKCALPACSSYTSIYSLSYSARESMFILLTISTNFLDLDI